MPYVMKSVWGQSKNSLIQQYRDGPRFTQHYRYDTAGRLTIHTLPEGSVWASTSTDAELPGNG
jgi:YD repeat-containing protein